MSRSSYLFPWSHFEVDLSQDEVKAGSVPGRIVFELNLPLVGPGGGWAGRTIPRSLKSIIITTTDNQNPIDQSFTIFVLSKTPHHLKQLKDKMC